MSRLVAINTLTLSRMMSGPLESAGLHVQEHTRDSAHGLVLEPRFDGVVTSDGCRIDCSGFASRHARLVNGWGHVEETL